MTPLSESRSELDAMIADIELTLVSIIQGVALTVLIEALREAIATFDWMMWPYVLSGLIIILVFWSRVVLHILTVIRWPLEFGHNFLYIACALVEAFAFAQLGNPGRWFAFVAAGVLLGSMFLTAVLSKAAVAFALILLTAATRLNQVFLKGCSCTPERPRSAKAR